MEGKYNKYFLITQFNKKFLYSIVGISLIIIFIGLTLFYQSINDINFYSNQAKFQNTIFFCDQICVQNAIESIGYGLMLFVFAIILIVISSFVSLLLIALANNFQLKPHLVVGIALNKLIKIKLTPRPRTKDTKKLREFDKKINSELSKNISLLKGGMSGVTNSYLYSRFIRETFKYFSKSLNKFFICLNACNKTEFDKIDGQMDKISIALKKSNFKSFIIKLEDFQVAYNRLPKSITELDIVIWKQFDLAKFLVSPFGAALISGLLAVVAAIISVAAHG